MAKKKEFIETKYVYVPETIEKQNPITLYLGVAGVLLGALIAGVIMYFVYPPYRSPEQVNRDIQKLNSEYQSSRMVQAQEFNEMVADMCRKSGGTLSLFTGGELSCDSIPNKTSTTYIWSQGLCVQTVGEVMCK